MTANTLLIFVFCLSGPGLVVTVFSTPKLTDREHCTLGRSSFSTVYIELLYVSSRSYRDVWRGRASVNQKREPGVFTATNLSIYAGYVNRFVA